MLTGQIPGALVLLGHASLVVGAARAMELAGGRLARQIAGLSSATWNVLLIAVFVFFGADLLLISRDILPAAVHFLILLMSIKLFHLRQRKDFLQLYAISFLELLAAAALTVDLWYAGVFIAYVFAAIWTLILYHLRNEAEEARAAVQAGKELHDPSPIPRPVTAQFFWATNGIAVVSFCLTMAIFFLIPRIGAGFFQKNRVDLIRTSGFSEKVDLGVIGAVKLDPTVVMRVELPDQKAPIPEGLYFRGAAYDTYDGRSWANRLAARRLLGRTPDGGFLVPSELMLAVPESAVMHQEILIEALAREVTSGESTPYGRARAIEQHLRRSYQYSLDVGTTVSADPVDDFLFTRKTGYCEHYATAMVVLLRALGIPARLVTGFLPGLWNDFGNYYTIRQQDAHAWVEVYFPRSGWVTFDPTPSVPAAVPSWVWWNIGKIVDSIRLRWDRYVVQYSFRDQMAVAKSLRDRSEKVRSEVSDFVSTVTRGLASARAWLVELAHAGGWALAIGLAAGTLVIGMVLAVLLRGHGRRQQQLDPRTPRQVAAIQLYTRM